MPNEYVVFHDGKKSPSDATWPLVLNKPQELSLLWGKGLIVIALPRTSISPLEFYIEYASHQVKTLNKEWVEAYAKSSNSGRPNIRMSHFRIQ